MFLLLIRNQKANQNKYNGGFCFDNINYVSGYLYLANVVFYLTKTNAMLDESNMKRIKNPAVLAAGFFP